RRQARPVHAELLEDQRGVGITGVEQLHEVVLDLDVVVGAGEAESGGGLDGAASRVVQLPDQPLEIDAHHTSPGMGRNVRTVSSASRVNARVRIQVDQPSGRPASPRRTPGTSSPSSTSWTSKSNWS